MMCRQLFIRRCAALFTVAASAFALPAGAQEKPIPPAAVPTARQTAPSDYLVRVGKHIMWKSQVEKMHPELKEKVVPISRKNQNDFLVTVGKKSVWASTVRRDPNAKTRPASHEAGCKDFLVQVGKKTEWASGVNCPMGKHTKHAKPLCCVAPIGDAKKMPKCCQHTP